MAAAISLSCTYVRDVCRLQLLAVQLTGLGLQAATLPISGTVSYTCTHICEHIVLLLADHTLVGVALDAITTKLQHKLTDPKWK